MRIVIETVDHKNQRYDTKPAPYTSSGDAARTVGYAMAEVKAGRPNPLGPNYVPPIPMPCGGLTGAKWLAQQQVQRFRSRHPDVVKAWDEYDRLARLHGDEPMVNLKVVGPDGEKIEGEDGQP